MRTAASISTHTTNSAEYERKNNPSTLMESITKHAENARKYERIFEYGCWCLTGNANGNSEADTVKSEGLRRVSRVVDDRREEDLPRATHPRIWFARGNPCFDRRWYTELAVMSIVRTSSRIYGRSQ
jgi:hypothetical protein